ncbi:MAG: zinc ribbon domain-containing protein [Patescibacteria group bacterium]|jgi:hypothetical protein
MTCQNCGHLNQEDAKFCINCGKVLVKSIEQKVNAQTVVTVNDSKNKKVKKKHYGQLAFIFIVFATLMQNSTPEPDTTGRITFFVIQILLAFFGMYFLVRWIMYLFKKKDSKK